MKLSLVPASLRCVCAILVFCTTWGAGAGRLCSDACDECALSSARDLIAAGRPSEARVSLLDSAACPGATAAVLLELAALLKHDELVLLGGRRPRFQLELLLGAMQLVSADAAQLAQILILVSRSLRASGQRDITLPDGTEIATPHAALVRAIQLDPAAADAYLALADLMHPRMEYIRLADGRELVVQDLLLEALRVAPNHVGARLAIARIAMMGDPLDERPGLDPTTVTAPFVLADALQVDPTNVDALFLAARSSLHAGTAVDGRKAAFTWRNGTVSSPAQLIVEALRYAPGAAALYHELALALENPWDRAIIPSSGDELDAFDLLRVAMRLDPTFADAQLTLAFRLLSCRDAHATHSRCIELGGPVRCSRDALGLLVGIVGSRPDFYEAWALLAQEADIAPLSDDLLLLASDDLPRSSVGLWTKALMLRPNALIPMVSTALRLEAGAKVTFADGTPLDAIEILTYAVRIHTDASMAWDALGQQLAKEQGPNSRVTIPTIGRFTPLELFVEALILDPRCVDCAKHAADLMEQSPHPAGHGYGFRLSSGTSLTLSEFRAAFVDAAAGDSRPTLAGTGWQTRAPPNDPPPEEVPTRTKPPPTDDIDAQDL